MSNVKKIFIYIGITIILCISSFVGGRFLRLAKISTDSIRAEQTIEQLNNKIVELQSKLDKRIEECEQLSSNIESTRTRIDECLLITKSIRSSIDELTITSGNIKNIIQELRNRIDLYEKRINELETSLSTVKDSLDQ